jgi:hypothetical protein
VVDSLGKAISNNSITISQGALHLERFTDSKGVLILPSNSINKAKEVILNMDGFLSKKLVLKDVDEAVVFKENLFQLDAVTINVKKPKSVKYENYKIKENRKSLNLTNYGKLFMSLHNNTELITAVKHLNDKDIYGNLKTISFEIKQRNSKVIDVDSAVYRLNIYDSKKNLVFSKDKFFLLSQIKKTLDFDIPNKLITVEHVHYVGVQYRELKSFNEYLESPAYQIMFETSTFTTAETYINEYGSSSKLQWQLFSINNGTLDSRFKELLYNRLDGTVIDNYNLHFTIVFEKRIRK